MKLKRYNVCTKPGPTGVVNEEGAVWEPGGWQHWCPACKSLHQIAVEHPFTNIDGTKKASWTFNNDLDKPTFNPSVKITIGPMPTVPEGRKDAGKVHICHYFITDGNIRYCGDCTHKLKGQTVPLPEIPGM